MNRGARRCCGVALRAHAQQSERIRLDVIVNFAEDDPESRGAIAATPRLMRRWHERQALAFGPGVMGIASV
jgi:hypothetical protein